jgi:hypothetical protein
VNWAGGAQVPADDAILPARLNMARSSHRILAPAHPAADGKGGPLDDTGTMLNTLCDQQSSLPGCVHILCSAQWEARLASLPKPPETRSVCRKKLARDVP